MIRVHVLDCGSTTVDEALPLSNRSRNPLAFTGIGRGKKHKVEVPVTAYLIEHPRARILVDTGWGTEIRDNARAYEGLFNYFASPGTLPPGKAVTEHLTRLGIAPAELDYVVLTHLDIDHAGGLPLLREAPRVMASEPEIAAAHRHNPRYLRRLWAGIELECFPAREVDLLGDGSVTLLSFTGHTAGLTGVRVEGERGFVVIAGDCGYARESWEQQVLPGITWNRAQAAASLRRLAAYGRDPRCRAILMSHDPEHATGSFEL